MGRKGKENETSLSQEDGESSGKQWIRRKAVTTKNSLETRLE